jgi:hypothetical protein
MPAGNKQVSAGGACEAFVADAVNRLPDASLIQLVGLADALFVLNQAQDYEVNSGAADLMTLKAPNPGDAFTGGDDGKIIRVTSTTAFAHKITSPVTTLQTGLAGTTSITFPAFAGASVTLKAFNGKWQLIAFNGVLVVA